MDVAKRQKLDLKAGNTVRVWQRIQEKNKTRLQAFEGMLIARKHGVEPGATFTVRRVSGGVGVEKTFPLYTPNIEKIDIVKRAKVRRSKLYYVRDKAAKEIRRRTKRLSSVAAQKAAEWEEKLFQEDSGESQLTEEETESKEEDPKEEKEVAEQEESSAGETDSESKTEEKEAEEDKKQE